MLYFRVVYFSSSSSSSLIFSFLIDLVIGERVIHVWNARVLVIEGDKL